MVVSPEPEKRVKPALIQVDPDDWEEFRKLCGKYRVSLRLRAMVKAELLKAGNSGK